MQFNLSETQAQEKFFEPEVQVYSISIPVTYNHQSEWTWVVEYIWTYVNMLHSKYSNEFPVLILIPVPSGAVFFYICPSTVTYGA